jgi:hypothetical protein
MNLSANKISSNNFPVVAKQNARLVSCSWGRPGGLNAFLPARSS